jgi:hypothetical protein
MKQTIEIPSEYNIKDLICETGKPFTNASKPFYFYYEDGCCDNKIELDITGYSFVLEIFFNDCLYLTSTNLVIEPLNVLYIDIPDVTLKKGQYDYKISFVGGNSVIKGKFIVNS